MTTISGCDTRGALAGGAMGRPTGWARVLVCGLSALGLVAGAATLSSIARADTAPGRYEVDETAGTVLDTATGRTWQRGEAGVTHDWADARAYCAGLKLAGGAWRLPSKKELQSIVDYTQPTGHAIDGAAFVDTQTAYYWTSSPFAFSSGAAWVLHSVTGGSNVVATGNNTLRVRCVR